MRRKVSTILDEALYRRTKMASARDGKKISELMAEALEAYLRLQAGGAPPSGVVAATWGALPLDRRRVRRILGQEDELLDA
jgi:hypothetical protein